MDKKPGYQGDPSQVGNVIRGVHGAGMVIHAGLECGVEKHSFPLIAWEDVSFPPARVDPAQFTVTGFDPTVNYMVHAPGTKRHGRPANEVRVIAPHVHQ